MSEPSLWAVILAGGVGSRFWPVSTPSRPKQLLRLAGDRPLITQTIERIRPAVPDERIRILAGEALRDPIMGAAAGLPAGSFMAEPAARGTAPVLAWAAAEIERLDPGAVMVSLHADHVIEPAAAFCSQIVRIARDCVSKRRLFTIGVTPSRPEKGYGYIRPGPPLSVDADAFEVAEFVEKPDAATAARYMAAGYLWNTGLFVWPTALLLEELKIHTPEVADHLHLLEEGRPSDFFAAVDRITIDVGLLERSRSVAVVRAAFDWDDVGTWDAVLRTRTADEHGNVAEGDAHFVDSDGCVGWAEQGSVVVFGGHDLIVVRTAGITFVAPRERAPDLKTLLDALPPVLRQPETE